MNNRIPDSFIEELIGRVDLIELISAYVKLKKTGANYSACCPFHQEKTPSFTVSPSKQFYHCFGCGAHGDALRFVMEQEGLGFVDAVSKLSGQLGMQVPTLGSSETEDRLEPLYQALKAARQFFIRSLEASPKAQAYLANRGLSLETVQSFGIGYAQDSWDALGKHLAKEPAQKQVLEQAGLLVHAEQKSYDRFRDRIMFPIQDKRGRVLGFGGRILDQGQPKYLNSPQTPVFHKGTLLFGLNLVVKQKQQSLSELLIVEGYMDAVMLYQAGFQGVLATLGTAVTTEQLKVLFSLHAQLVFCFDGDLAGFAASQKTMKLLLPWMQDGRSVRFIFLPEGEDPDSFIRKEGEVSFRKILAEAIPLSAFFFQQLQKRVAPTTIDARAQFVQLAKEGLYELPKGVFRELMFQQLAELVGTSKNVLEGKPWRTAPVKKKLVNLQQPAEPALFAVALLKRYPELAGDLGDLSWLKNAQELHLQILLETIQCLQGNPGSALPVQEEGVLAELIPAHGAKQELNDIFRKLQEHHYQKELDNLLFKSKSSVLDEAERQRLKVLLKKPVTR